MWFVLALLSALFQVLRNMSMKHLGHALDDTINVWGRFTFILPFLAGFVLWHGIPSLQPGFWWYVCLFGVVQTIATLSLSKALTLSDISIVTSLWKISLLLLVMFAFFTLGETPSLLGFPGHSRQHARRLPPQYPKKPRLVLGPAARDSLSTGACATPWWRQFSTLQQSSY